METKNKFNIIDVIIIVVILLLAATFIFRYLELKKTSSKVVDTTVSYTLEVNGIDSEFADKIKTGDTIYARDLKSGCGTVKSVKTSFYRSTVYLPDGKAETHVNPQFKNLEIVVETKAQLSEDAFYLTSENFPVFVGKEIGLSNGIIAFNATVTAFSAE
ncbi:MAG: DUF4330 domain-containing protein [Clostridiales bacterium]|nr:DUF4330 domain-containing protein [Clostridiales bacterium]